MMSRAEAEGPRVRVERSWFCGDGEGALVEYGRWLERELHNILRFLMDVFLVLLSPKLFFF